MLPLTFLRARIVMFVYFVRILNLFLQLYFYFIFVTNEKKKGIQAFDCHIDTFCVFRQNKEVEFWFNKIV